ncbi:hypothetical protein V7793_18310 [Streptomyces sp. KLMMK]
MFAVTENCCVLHDLVHAGLPESAGVVAAAGERPRGRHDQAGVGVDYHLMIDGVAVVLGAGGDTPVLRCDQGAIGDRHGARRVSTLNRERVTGSGAMWPMTRSAVGFEIPNRGPSYLIVRFVRQYTATSMIRSSGGKAHVGTPPP